MTQTISGYSFTPADLRVEQRKPGISAFMRIRNGADFLEATIRSHMPFFDEIVAVHNQCTDATPEILGRLELEFGGRLRVYHYTDRVYPPGSDDHARTEPSSPHSLVNYYNTALALTTRRVATKLDDDHLAIPDRLAVVAEKLRKTEEIPAAMYCFSGLNLLKTQSGTLAIPADDPVSGGGDIGFFPVSSETYFAHDSRFERFRRGDLRRVFTGFLYWHLKFLKPGMGFANYEIDAYPKSRYAARRAVMATGPSRALTLSQLVALKKPRLKERLAALISAKHRLLIARNRSLVDTFQGLSIDVALDTMSDPALRRRVLGEAAP